MRTARVQNDVLIREAENAGERRGKDSDFSAQNHVSSTGLPSPDPGVIDFCW